MKRKIVVFRHGERVDAEVRWDGDAIGDWVGKAFHSDGAFHRFDPRIPDTLPERKDPKETFRRDSPLTVSGYKDAVTLGKQLGEFGEVPDEIFVSPALRCLQTCQAILKGMGLDKKMRMEPSLLELYSNRPVTPCLTRDEQLRAGFNVELHYQPYAQIDNLQPKETYEDAYARLHGFMTHTLLNLFPNAKVIWMVGHSASLDYCTRNLRGLPALSREEYWEMLPRLCPWKLFLLSVAIKQTSPDVDWEWTEAPALPTAELRALQHHHRTRRVSQGEI